MQVFPQGSGLKNDPDFSTISDTGQVLSKENLSGIVDPFFTSKDEGKETGQRLYFPKMCHHGLPESRYALAADYNSLKMAAALSISSGQNTNRHLASGEDTEP